jgi:hypothetical protein
LSGRSPKAFRISRMYFLRTSGLTSVSDHNASKISPLRHYPLRVVDQVNKYVKSPGRQGDSISIAPQKVVRRIQTERLE